MVENFVIVSSTEHARHRVQLKPDKQYVPIKSPGLVSGTDMVWVVTFKDPGTLQSRQFEFTSCRSDRRIDQLNIPTDIHHHKELRFPIVLMSQDHVVGLLLY